jgi:hypothetical protein
VDLAENARYGDCIPEANYAKLCATELNELHRVIN